MCPQNHKLAKLAAKKIDNMKKERKGKVWSGLSAREAVPADQDYDIGGKYIGSPQPETCVDDDGDVDDGWCWWWWI